MSSEERASASNGIHLCKLHARLIDVDVNDYPAEKLKEIKLAHEQQVRALITGHNADFDPDFPNSHESQIVHGRGSPTLNDLWVQRHITQPQTGNALTKLDPITHLTDQTGINLISGEQWSGRTSLLKRIAAHFLNQKNCIWLDAQGLTEKYLKDPVQFLAAGYKKLNPDEDGWKTFLDAAPSENLILLDDLHLCPLNTSSRRRFLCLLQGLSDLVVSTVNGEFLIEILAVEANDGLRLNYSGLLDLSRADCALLVDRWCRFGSATVPDPELDARIATAQGNVELLFGKHLMPRQPLFVLTALQMIDAGSPTDTKVGSFGGVYETLIHLAICKNSPNQATISSERAYLEELANWCLAQPGHLDRQAFNAWFAERKGIRPVKVAELEESLLAKRFLSRQHQGFRFNYQRYYFQASFIRNNPERPGIKEFITKMINESWNEDYANTALFLVYLQPSSSLVEASRILSEQIGTVREA